MVLIPLLLIYCRINIMGMHSRNYCDNSMYLATLVISAFWFCSLLSHMIRNLVYIFTYPVNNFAVLKSLRSVLCC